MAPTTLPTQTAEMIRLTLIEEAEIANAEFPQYRGYFDGWGLGIVVRDIWWGEGRFANVTLDPSNLSARKGDFVLVEPSRGYGSYGPVAYLPNSAVGSGRGIVTTCTYSQVETVKVGA